MLLLLPATGKLDTGGRSVRDKDRREAGLCQAKREAGSVFAHGHVRTGKASLSPCPDEAYTTLLALALAQLVFD